MAQATQLSAPLLSPTSSHWSLGAVWRMMSGCLLQGEALQSQLPITTPSSNNGEVLRF